MKALNLKGVKGFEHKSSQCQINYFVNIVMFPKTRSTFTVDDGTSIFMLRERSKCEGLFLQHRSVKYVFEIDLKMGTRTKSLSAWIFVRSSFLNDLLCNSKDR